MNFDTRMQIIPKMTLYPFCNLLRLPKRWRRRKKAASRTFFTTMWPTSHNGHGSHPDGIYGVRFGYVL